jgi:hypothetical protein
MERLTRYAANLFYTAVVVGVGVALALCAWPFLVFYFPELLN